VTRRLARAALACALAIVAIGGLSACGKEEEHGEPRREGLRVELGGLEYNVFLTRQLNLATASDKAYYNGEPAGPGRALYGVFLETCNRGDGGAHRSADLFVVTDNQENEFEPVEIEPDNPFAYRPRVLAERECIPAIGSPAQLGPTGGAMLLFDLPLEATENRPLELHISAPVGDDPQSGVREEAIVELDI
jgi:hypothetical protein